MILSIYLDSDIFFKIFILYINFNVLKLNYEIWFGQPTEKTCLTIKRPIYCTAKVSKKKGKKNIAKLLNLVFMEIHDK